MSSDARNVHLGQTCLHPEGGSSNGIAHCLLGNPFADTDSWSVYIRKAMKDLGLSIVGESLSRAQDENSYRETIKALTGGDVEMLVINDSSQREVSLPSDRRPCRAGKAPGHLSLPRIRRDRWPVRLCCRFARAVQGHCRSARQALPRAQSRRFADLAAEQVPIPG